MRTSPIRGLEHGATLVVGLVMLVMLTLMALSAFMLSSGNLTAVGNLQAKDQAISAANFAVEQVISTDFMTAPIAQTVAVDLNRDGTNEFSVSVPAPVCTRWRTILSSELDVDDPGDAPCFGIGGSGGASFCADTVWQVRAIVADQATGAAVTVNQGVKKRMSVTVAENYCD